MIDFVFTNMILDRAHHLRADQAWIAEQIAAGQARTVTVWRDKVLIRNAGSGEALIVEGASTLHDEASELVFLGMDGDTAYFAADISHLEEPFSAAIPGDGDFEDLRALAPNLEHGIASMLAHARALGYWHRTHQFCGVCGSPTESRKAGHERKCSDETCGKTHFPRTDPAVIMLVTHDDGSGPRALLAQNKRFPSGIRFSTVAGFVEPGETLEQAVAREVKEETGVDVTDVVYQASQPWPFPASIMLGFRARALTTEITIQDDELADARWFTRDEVAELAAQDGVLPPSKFSISRWLIDTWLDETAA